MKLTELKPKYVLTIVSLLVIGFCVFYIQRNHQTNIKVPFQTKGQYSDFGTAKYQILPLMKIDDFEASQSAYATNSAQID